MTQRLERLIYALLLLLRYNEGLSLISPADFASGKLILWVDASSRAVGCLLTILLEDNIIYSLYCASKALPKNSKSFCSNTSELFAVGVALSACSQLIATEACTVMTDSMYVWRCFNMLDIESIPMRLRALVLDIKVSYNVSFCHISAVDN